MGDLIDRQKAIDAIGERPYTWTDSEYELGKQNQYDDDLQSILNLKKVDAVPVVRCKDCVRWNTILDRTKAEYGLCQIRSQLEATKHDDFCSRGERRTDAD